MAVDTEAAPTIVKPVPDWVLKQMPHGYQTRVEEIQRLSSEIKEMERFGWLLCETGESLEQAVHDTFTALKADVEPLPGGGTSQFAVKIDPKRRLLAFVAESDGTIHKQSDVIEQVFRLLQREAEDTDRVVLIANVDRTRPPAERQNALSPDAETLLKRLGTNFLSAASLFAIWQASLQDLSKGRALLEKLHAREGGIFAVPAT